MELLSLVVVLLFGEQRNGYSQRGDFPLQLSDLGFLFLDEFERVFHNGFPSTGRSLPAASSDGKRRPTWRPYAAPSYTMCLLSCRVWLKGLGERPPLVV